MSCTYTFEGSSKTVRVEPTIDVYHVPELAVDEPFALKFVYVTRPTDVAAFRIYAYYVANHGHVLVHEAKYAPPYQVGGRFGFTGLAAVYDFAGAELTYTCSAAP